MNFPSPLASRIKSALEHIKIYGPDRDTLWPYQPFAMTIQELLCEAAKSCSNNSPVPLSEWQKMEQQLAAKDADARRYRWLRNNLRNDSLVMDVVGYILVGDELDEAIDKELGK
jgi:hypothetical protein